MSSKRPKWVRNEDTQVLWKIFVHKFTSEKCLFWVLQGKKAPKICPIIRNEAFLSFMTKNERLKSPSTIIFWGKIVCRNFWVEIILISCELKVFLFLFLKIR